MTGRPGNAGRIAGARRGDRHDHGARSTPPVRCNAPPGAAKPNAGTGIGTAAALANPKCAHDDATRFGVYGRLSSTIVGGGPVCVKPWKEGADNGGATAPGVTKDRILIYAIIPNDQQLSMVGGATPTEARRQLEGHLPGRDPRLPAHRDEVLRDLRARHRTALLRVDGPGRGRPARRRSGDQGREALRGDGPRTHCPRRVRHRDGQLEDHRLRLRHHHAEGARPGTLPMGAERHAGGGDQLDRGDRQATRREEGAVRR